MDRSRLMDIAALSANHLSAGEVWRRILGWSALSTSKQALQAILPCAPGATRFAKGRGLHSSHNVTKMTPE
jgi:hypothetical protein